MRPFLKRVGGKTKLLPELRARLPKTFNRYFEPFVGGGALFFNLTPPNAMLGDASCELITTYRGVADRVCAVIDLLESHQQAHKHDGYYYEVRGMWNEGCWTGDMAEHAAAFIYLNKTCFNGLWRVNKKGKFNVPQGDYKNPTICDQDALLQASAVLRRAELHAGTYEETTASAESGDFIYCDPPYDPINTTSNFTAYTKDVFGRGQQGQLAQWARGMRDRGIHVMLSNNDTPFIRDLYKDFWMDGVKCGRAINSKGDRRGQVDEVIITSYERSL